MGILQLPSIQVIGLFIMLFVPFVSQAQSKANDIDASALPSEVKQVLDQYISMLNSASSLEDAASKFVSMAGGSLVNEDGKTLRSSVMPFSLKKDFNNAKFYKNPAEITRVNKNANAAATGFGPSAIKGTVYKIWVAKKEGVNGMPAPISIMVPEGHPSINTPKITSIGSL